MILPKPKARWSGVPDTIDHGGGASASLAGFIVNVLPDQFVSSPRWEPEQWLAAAMLCDAEHMLHNAKERHWVIEWLLAEFVADYPFSLVCTALNLDEDATRTALLKRTPAPKARALA